MSKDMSIDADNSAGSVGLGPLETEIMGLVWDRPEATVREVYRALLARRDIAYTTVMTVMGNLVVKGALKRRMEGRMYVYSAVLSRDDFTHARIAHLVDNLLGRFTEPAMTYLVDRMAQVDPKRLAELEKAIARLRRSGGRPSGG